MFLAINELIPPAVARGGNSDHLFCIFDAIFRFLKRQPRRRRKTRKRRKTQISFFFYKSEKKACPCPPPAPPGPGGARRPGGSETRIEPRVRPRAERPSFEFAATSAPLQPRSHMRRGLGGLGRWGRLGAARRVPGAAPGPGGPEEAGSLKENSEAGQDLPVGT